MRQETNDLFFLFLLYQFLTDTLKVTFWKDFVLWTSKKKKISKEKNRQFSVPEWIFQSKFLNNIGKKKNPVW